MSGMSKEEGVDVDPQAPKQEVDDAQNVATRESELKALQEKLDKIAQLVSLKQI